MRLDAPPYGPETFLARVADDGTVPPITAGDWVYVDPDEPAVHGSVVLFGHGGDAVVRLLVVEDGRRAPRAARPGRRRAGDRRGRGQRDRHPRRGGVPRPKGLNRAPRHYRSRDIRGPHAGETRAIGECGNPVVTGG